MLKANPDAFNYENLISFTENRQTDRLQTIITQRINTTPSTDTGDEINALPVEHLIPKNGLQHQSIETDIVASSPKKLSSEKKSNPVDGKTSENETDKQIDGNYLTSNRETGSYPQVTVAHDKISLNLEQKARSVSRLPPHILQSDIIDDHYNRINPFPLKIVVKKGEYLTRLCQEIYGYTSDALIDHVKSHNPQIENSDLILIGDHLTFPEPIKETQ